MPFPAPGDLSTPRIEPVSPALAVGLSTTEPPGKPESQTYQLPGTSKVLISNQVFLYLGLPGGSEGKASACTAGDLGSIPGLERSPGEGNGTPLQYSFLENSMDGGAWWATVHGVPKS